MPALSRHYYDNDHFTNPHLHLAPPIICTFQVLEIITLRKEGLRGQAFIVFDDVQASTAAIQAENGTMFFGKELKLGYAHEKSDRIAKRDGSYVPLARRVKVKVEQPQAAPTAPTSVAAAAAPEIVKATSAPEPPSRIIFAQDLPSDINNIMLEMLFQPYEGYQEVRIPREGLAFIEFDDEPHATLALKGLNGFKLTTKDVLKLKYGKA
jgi:U2 small nuclear ribonucleoprotein B''